MKLTLRRRPPAGLQPGRCQATTVTGARCKLPAVPGTSRCVFHPRHGEGKRR